MLGTARIQKQSVLRSVLALALATTLGALPAAAQTPPTKVTATGQAAIYGTDTAHARDKAIEDAMRKAVEQAVGAIVSSETVTQNFELISDKIFSQSKGYVRSHKVISEGKDGGVYQVKIEAEVASGNLESDVKGILAVLKAKNMPRVLLMVSEQNVGSSKTSAWWTGADSYSIDIGAVENTFIDKWKPKGFKFVDRQALTGKLSAKKSLSANPADNEIKEFAAATGAEVVIIGQAIANDVGTIMGTQMHSVRANISVRALNLDNGDILGTSTQSQAVGHIDPTTGGTQALQKVAEKAGEDLLKKILEGWESEVAGPSTVNLTIKNVQKSKQLRQLQETLRDQARGITDIRQRSYTNKVAELEVSIKGKAQDLAEELEDKKFPGFQIEIDSVTANTVTATLK